jgi:alpha-mannosidase
VDRKATDTAHVIGHAHIDMNWLWLWPETVDVCKNTFTEMLQDMTAFPDFKFSQSQASTYLAMQEYHPDILAQIGKRVAEGRWDVSAGTWTEGDMNMPSGEAIVRQIMYSKQFFQRTFGLGLDDIRMCWEPDTFGHAWSIPQIMRKAGLEDYFFCRCGPGPAAFCSSATCARIARLTSGGRTQIRQPGTTVSIPTGAIPPGAVRVTSSPAGKCFGSE